MVDRDGIPTTVAMHVIDDAFVTSASDDKLEKFESYMRGGYCEIKVNKGQVLDYLGMTFDFILPVNYPSQWPIAWKISSRNAGYGRVGRHRRHPLSST